MASQILADDDDSETVRRLIQQGSILSIEQLLVIQPQLEQMHWLDIELESEHQRWVYEFKLLGDEGAVIEMLFDAQTGEWLHQDNNKEEDDD